MIKEVTGKELKITRHVPTGSPSEAFRNSGKRSEDCHLRDKYMDVLINMPIQCPCIECLIKSVCITGCYPRSKFADKIVEQSVYPRPRRRNKKEKNNE